MDRSIETFHSQLDKTGQVMLDIKVTPKSSRNAILGFMDDGTLKVALTVAPEKGKANEALLKLLADEFDVAVSNISIIKGENQPRKRVVIEKNKVS